MSARSPGRRAVHALIPAAGSGRRFAAEGPKQYQSLLGRPLLAYSIGALQAHPRVASLTVVLAPGDEDFNRLLERDYPAVDCVIGGDSRAQSVLNGLRHLLRSRQESDWALVHDAARPCLDTKALDRLLQQAMASPDGGILALPLVDTIKRGRDGRIEGTVDRSALWAAQTPQLFPLGILAGAMAKMLEEGLTPTDEAAAMEHAGYHPVLVTGDRDNLKVTHRADLQLAAQILARREKEDAP